jgi:NADH-quinone oxidoreductase subunit A
VSETAGKGGADDRHLAELPSTRGVYRGRGPDRSGSVDRSFPFDDARMKFDVRFYLVAILFIIFDLEVAFLFPWAVAFGKLGATGFWSMLVFLAVLTVGFAYEWKKGALEWD